MNKINIVLTFVFIGLSCYYDNWWIICAYCARLLFQAITVELNKP